MKNNVSIIVLLAAILLSACDTEVEKGVMKSDLTKDVALSTELGEIIFRLSDETPKHRNNFIKLVNQGFYDSIAFHRVIEGFLIQTGNPETRESRTSDPAEDFTIPAEINTTLFHKRGAINAARNGDDFNTDQASSGTQFTIIQGKTYTDSTLAIAEKRINNWLAYNQLINDPKYKIYFERYTDILLRMDSLYATENKNDLAQVAVLEITYNEIQSRFINNHSAKNQNTLRPSKGAS